MIGIEPALVPQIVTEQTESEQEEESGHDADKFPDNVGRQGRHGARVIIGHIRVEFVGHSRIGQGVAHQLGGIVDSRIDIAVTHIWDNCSAYYIVARHIGQDTLHAVAGLYTADSLVGDDDQHCAVVLVLLAHAPAREHLLGPVLDGDVADIGHHDHHHLAGRDLSQRSQPLVDARCSRGVEHIGRVADVMVAVGNVRVHHFLRCPDAGGSDGRHKRRQQYCNISQIFHRYLNFIRPADCGR